jgi:hypothetical protein
MCIHVPIEVDQVMRVELDNALDLGLGVVGRGRRMNSKVGIQTKKR